MLQDKQQLCAKISDVFVQRGYDGATLAHLASACGLSKASLYHHFPGGKPEMAATLVRMATANLQREAFASLTRERDVTDALREFIKGFGRYVQQGQSDCLLAIFSHHTTAHQEIAALQQQIRRQFADWHTLLSATLEQTGIKPKKAQRQAHDLISALYGALMNAKLHNNPELFQAALKRHQKQLQPSV